MIANPPTFHGYKKPYMGSENKRTNLPRVSCVNRKVSMSTANKVTESVPKHMDEQLSHVDVPGVYISRSSYCFDLLCH